VRCHDDIGLGFDDSDILAVGYEPSGHRKFLIDYYTGDFADSSARGVPFGRNEKNGDARISGSLASLAGLQSALEQGHLERVDAAIEIILLLHSMILSFGGIPLFYYGDELGKLNDFSYQDDPNKSGDSRWVHRPVIDWEHAGNRNVSGTVEYRIFSALKRMIAVRKETGVFADFNNRELIEVENPHLFVFGRYNPLKQADRVLVVANFNGEPQYLKLDNVSGWINLQYGQLVDLYSGSSPDIVDGSLVVPGHGFYWLGELI
jgi:amylosucrase